MSLYLKNATYVDWQTLAFKQCHVEVDEGVDGGIRFLTELPGVSDKSRVLDCSGKLVTKSFACGHHHVYSALARGMGAPKKIPSNFHEILKYIWWTLDKCLDLEMIEASALVTAIYCAKNGVTFVIDHHASPMAVNGSLETIAAAFDKVGVGHLLCYEMSDRDGEASCQQGLEETENYLKGHRQGLVGLHASFTVGDDLLKKAVALAGTYGSGIHVHVAEDPVDQEFCLRDHNNRVVERLRDSGALDFKKTILAHSLHINDNERKILEASPVYIAQNTDSNLNNNVGTFDASGLRENQVILGTDGMYSDMLRSAKAAYLVGQTVGGVSPETIYRRFRRVHEYLDTNDFKGDGPNNLVVLDYDSPTEINPGNFFGHFAYGIDSGHVESVIANGRLIIENRRMLTVDENEIIRFSRQMGRKLWDKMSL